ncbi:3-oxoacyl-[acyl-carrier protein] reductase [Desulfocicer vacuolatum DSM 3385]|uniref:3-oxoacyl-[acyl-carrier protein] reductase n=1 Tax=Desulfocicer vacuolatum DSM 3385 TaxID=1121400 RepID=A0A1W1ZWF6_9BACT|nr:SDR family oxidoreductase [Desulfocicer vacuolatum]SMC52398.1 3-oxoacyl-[acyl-carrier protein] reductase [Desulfocicer vacuolatum DSM 3385]
MKLQGKVALVLGAVKGIGRGIGLALAHEGVSLALTRHDWSESFGQMEIAFGHTGADHEIFDVNLLEIDAIERLIVRVKERFGRLDILINNIERGGWPVVHGAYVQDQWDLEMATTLRAKRWVFDLALPLLQSSGDGAVINFSSIAGVCGRSGPAAALFNDGYAAASRGISMLTETWARMGAPHVRVNEIMLGVMETRHAQGTRGWETVLTGKEKAAIVDHTLLGRTGTVEDVVKAVLFMLRDAPYMTGSVLRLDGGYTLGGEGVPPMPPGIL